MRKSWDFDEHATDYECFEGTYIDEDSGEKTETFVYVKTGNRDRKRIQSIAEKLLWLDMITRKAQDHCRKNYMDDIYLKLFTETEHVFYELERNTSFDGVNKPKNVHNCKRNNIDIVGKDGSLRAHVRHVMLVLEGKDCARLKDLYVHEISHTLANHVLFRINDHGKDFEDCREKFEKVLTEISYELTRC